MGVFTKEQVRAFATRYPQDQLVVSLHGHDRFRIAPRHFLRLPTVLFDLLATPRQALLAPNAIEILRPVVHWSSKLLKGNFPAVLRAHEQNFLWAKHRLGHVDVLHAHVAFPAGAIALHLSRKFDIPYVITEHMGPFPLPVAPLVENGRISPVLLETIKCADQVIAVSEQLARAIENACERRPIVIPNFVDESLFFPVSTVRKTPECFVFACMASIRESKGIGDLLCAARLLKSEGLKFKIRIGGSGPDINKYKRFCTDNDLGEEIEWIGQISRADAPRFYREANAFVLPSHHESFGMVFVEAMASGLPVVATKCGGPEEIIGTESGIFVTIGDVAGLAGAMERMIRSIGDFDRNVIRDQFERRFSASEVLGRIRDALLGVMPPVCDPKNRA